MKKFVAMMMVILVLVSCTMMAHAELRYETSRIDLKHIATKSNGEKIWDDRYYVKAISDTGVVQEIEVTKEEYESLWDIEHPATARPWYAKIASVATFWNPND